MTYDGNCLDGEYDYDQVYDWRNKKWVELDKSNEIKVTTHTREHVCQPPHPRMNVWSTVIKEAPPTCDKCGWPIEPKTKTTIVRGEGYAYGHTEHTS